MVKTNKLLGIIAEKKSSQTKIANELGMTPKTFYTKMKKGVFDSDEIQHMIRILEINDPVSIFFAE